MSRSEFATIESFGSARTLIRAAKGARQAAVDSRGPVPVTLKQVRYHEVKASATPTASVIMAAGKPDEFRATENGIPQLDVPVPACRNPSCSSRGWALL